MFSSTIGSVKSNIYMFNNIMSASNTPQIPNREKLNMIHWSNGRKFMTDKTPLWEPWSREHKQMLKLWPDVKTFSSMT